MRSIARLKTVRSAMVVVSSMRAGERVYLTMYNGKHNVWELPGGKKEPEESIVQTAARELAEEANVYGDEKLLDDFLYLEYPTVRGGVDTYVYATVFLHTDLEKYESYRINIIPGDGMINYVWRSINEVRAMKDCNTMQFIIEKADQLHNMYKDIKPDESCKCGQPYYRHVLAGGLAHEFAPV